MADAIDNVVTYEGKQASEIFKLPFVENPTLTAQGVKVINDIQSKLYLYYSTKLSKITKKRTGCGNTETGEGAIIDRELIEVTDMNIFLPQCADKFNGTILEFAKKKGVEINDLSDTEIDKFIADLIIEAAAEDYLRQQWFGDTSLIGDDDYSAYDGHFVNITAGVAAADIVNNSIAAMTTGQHAHDALLAVYEDQPRVMKRTPKANRVFLVTENIFELYESYLSALNGSEVSYKNTTDGLDTLKFRGIDVIKMDLWDQVFEEDFPSDFGNGRIVLHVKEEALIVGLDAEGDETKIESWYSKDDDVQKYRVRYKVGTKIKFNEMMSVAGFEAASS